MKKYVAEFIETLWLALRGCGSDVLAAAFPQVGIGLLGLTLIHLISIPVTNTSVNPARSTSQAIFVRGEAIQQLWLLYVAPIAGATTAGVGYKYFNEKKRRNINP